MQTETAHILFIDDKINVVNQAKAWLIDEFGYQHLETATSAAEALEKLKQPFDIIVADMRMEENNSGFKILNHVQEKNLSSVVIILTANDTVQDCRAAFRKKAWDYISKSMRGNAFDELNRSIQDAIAYFNRWGNQQNQQWCEENQKTLEETYWGQYIAILNQDVIESADTEKELNQRLAERQLRRFTITVQKIGDLKPISELLKLEESNTLEFKQGLDMKNEAVDNRKDTKKKEKEDLRLKVLKSIASFLNTDGGTLLIGVTDSGQVFGLEQEPIYRKASPRDNFEQHLNNLIDEAIGKLFSPYIRIRFERIQNKDICAIYVRKAEQTAFVRYKKNLYLYLRIGNTTRSVTVPEIYNYL